MSALVHATVPLRSITSAGRLLIGGLIMLTGPAIGLSGLL